MKRPRQEVYSSYRGLTKPASSQASYQASYGYIYSTKTASCCFSISALPPG